MAKSNRFSTLSSSSSLASLLLCLCFAAALVNAAVDYQQIMPASSINTTVLDAFGCGIAQTPDSNFLAVVGNEADVVFVTLYQRNSSGLFAPVTTFHANNTETDTTTPCAVCLSEDSGYLAFAPTNNANTFATILKRNVSSGANASEPYTAVYSLIAENTTTWYPYSMACSSDMSKIIITQGASTTAAAKHTFLFEQSSGEDTWVSTLNSSITAHTNFPTAMARSGLAYATVANSTSLITVYRSSVAYTLPSSDVITTISALTMDATGDTVFAGETAYPSSSNLGRVLVWTWNSDAGEYDHFTQLNPPSIYNSSHAIKFGSSLSACDDGLTVLIGMPGVNNNGGAAAVYVNPNNGSDWYYQPAFLAPFDNSTLSNVSLLFGSSYTSYTMLSSNGSIAVVGAPESGTLDRGRVYVFSNVSECTTWTPVSPPTAPSGSPTTGDLALGLGVGLGLGLVVVAAGIAAAVYGCKKAHKRFDRV